MSEPLLVMDLLRERTRDHHRRTESLPFFQQLAAGKVPVERYLEMLRALEIVHESLEEQAATCAHPAVRRVFTDDMRRLALLRRDLDEAGFDRRGAATPALLEAEVLAERIRRWAHDEPMGLLGCLYVFVGSTLGGAFIAGLTLRAQRAPSVSGRLPVAYFTNGGRPTEPLWDGFSRRMNAALAGAADMERAALSACATFDAIAAVLGHLAAPREAHRPPVGVLNPDAGYHPITDDLREIRAVLRAGAETWRRYPYYEHRYGERGRRFARSDSAWLAMLAQFPEQYVLEQAAWLGRVLSARGMPRLLLEDHFTALHRHLCSAVPEQKGAYDKLRGARDMLRRERLSAIAEGPFEALAAAFDAGVERLEGSTVRNMGRILVAAVADEAAGLTAAVTSVDAWVTDPARFSPAWTEAVRSAIAAARRAAGRA